MGNQNTALITGASGGIGLELAKLHAADGGDLVLVARSEDKLERIKNELEAEHRITVTVLTQDLAQPDAAQRIFAETQRRGIHIDVLINNAGFGGHGSFHRRDLAAEQAMMQVNMVSLTDLTHLYLPGMIARKKGRILNVSSVVSFMPGPLHAVYSATKAFVTSFSQAIAQEVAEHNITVTALCPGPVATGFVDAAGVEGVDVWKKAKSAQSVARFGYRAMQEGKLVAINEPGLRLMVNWIMPFLPRKTILNLSRRLMEKSAPSSNQGTPS
ncbi:MAG: SDR family oxidoreductase [Ectothiorhodospiraceae bacterium AqS1]|nr:SDR family oxidoreductase [Ectothiorhodospiraceae bacterium AqS1]